MEEVKKSLNNLTRKQQIEFIALGVVGLCVIISIIFMFKAMKGNEYTNQSVDTLQQQNIQLQKNNEQLIQTVQSLNVTVRERMGRDSVLANLVEDNNRLLPGINNRLNNIDKQYEKNAINTRAYTVSDVEGYIAAEASRLRSMQ